VNAYLVMHGLDDQITVVFAPTSDSQTRETAVLQLIAEAAGKLGANPADCALITSTAVDIEAARTAGAHSIGYAKTPDECNLLADAGAVIGTMADLTLRLRAVPAAREL
jgi:beta-phosphoglucomutase-like phosphatase (HAD superfamily)